ncbi:chemotaxis protein CheW [Xanthomonas graminis]|uniref:Chemotaxis protein CheW n=3 Tax=Xanthomonas translucens group TaxID=3390202 RepID=A0A0K2ZH15_9XANT|nr:chemotaxis protein CheW [Xanthomonas translucens]UKE79316.1 chemotaxis protein CheW [Xanthomonas translucens pv. arrhenatheri]CTP82650.1 chemotaxis signal transduction protein [Xanthomonas translucens pv. arrhenatheri LMG 727]
MNTPGVIDDYLEGLLHDVIAEEQDAARQATLAAASAAPAPAPEPLHAVAAPAPAGPTPEELAAAVLAEADADPTLAGIMSQQAPAPKPTGPTPEELAAAVLAEADADPALAGIMSQQALAPKPAGPTPEELAAAVLAEADADPALAGIMSQQALAPKPAGPTPEELAAAVLAEADADPALAGIMSQQALAPKPASPTPEEIAAAVLAEADSDPALAGIMSQQAPSAAERDADLEVVAAMEMQRAAAPPRDLAAEDDAAAARAIKRPPMGVPPERRVEAERAQAAGARLPPNLQAFMAPSVPHEASPHQRRAPDRSTRWLRLRCGEQAYALELLKVQEVVLPVPLLALRGTPPAMLGIMNLRGQVVPVIDLGIHLGAAPIEMDMLTRVVVLEENGETLGLRVSAVEDVASLTDQQIEPPDNARICRISNHLFRGVARLAQQPMILLDAEQLLH